MAKTTKRTVPGKAPAPRPPAGVRFVDFSIRAWREGPYVQGMAHSSPTSRATPRCTRSCATKDKTHLRALLGTEILRAAETMYGDLKPRTVIS
jgi:hypothetical protein